MVTGVSGRLGQAAASHADVDSKQDIDFVTILYQTMVVANVLVFHQILHFVILSSVLVYWFNINKDFFGCL